MHTITRFLKAALFSGFMFLLATAPSSAAWAQTVAGKGSNANMQLG